MQSAFLIPRLAPTIPHNIVGGNGKRQVARLAKCLLDAGVIHGDVPARRATHSLETCRHFLEQWVKSELAGLATLPVAFRMHLGRHDPYAGTPTGGDGNTVVTWYPQCRQFVVGPALERLEQVLPGLGATVLSVLDERSFNLLPLFTPVDVLRTASEHYWYGEDNEELALEERCDMSEDHTDQDENARAALRESIREEMVTREMIDTSFPAWATQTRRGRQRLSQRALRQIAQTARSAKVRSIARDVLTLWRLKVNDEYRPTTDGWFVAFSGVLTWKEDDVAVRVFDDYVNDAIQGEYIDWIGEFEFGVDDPQAVQGWVSGMAIRFEGMRILDRLIRELSTGDWRHVPKGFR